MEYIYSIKTQRSEIYKEKGSKFISFIFRVQDKMEVKSKLEELREANPKAGHVCYAYRLSKEVHFMSDDGEPKNSAGLPILNQILSHELNQVLIAVVRYFGGTKLGLSGLTNAYKTSSKMVINSSNIIKLQKMSQFLVKSDNVNLSPMLKEIGNRKFRILDHSFEADYHLITVESALEEVDFRSVFQGMNVSIAKSNQEYWSTQE
ncbi:MAG: YigZ family protein, partial [Flavobacteriales bacterium]|nr:YigZ family protein [Flavobacteriales bacterium]